MGRLFSDHHVVFFRIAYQSMAKTSRTQAYRKFTNINHAAFSCDILKEVEENPPGKTLREKIQCYNNILSSAPDTHDPVKHCKCLNKPKVSWFSDTIAKAICHHRNWKEHGTKTRPTVNISGPSTTSVGELPTY